MTIKRRRVVLKTGLMGPVEFAVACDRCTSLTAWDYNSQGAIEDAIGMGWQIAGNDNAGDLCEDCLRKAYPQEVN